MAEWREVGGKLTRTFGFESFAKAIAFVNKAAEAAEAADHHPDIHIHYKKVTLELTTHSAGGITGKDRELAKRIDALTKAVG